MTNKTSVTISSTSGSQVNELDVTPTPSFLKHWGAFYKTFILSVAVIFAVVSMTGCGERSQDNNNQSPKPTSPKPTSPKASDSVSKSVPILAPKVIVTEKKDGSRYAKVVLKPVESSNKPEIVSKRNIPNPIDLREHKQKGSKYICRMENHTAGEGISHKYYTGEAKVSFDLFTVINWETEVLENNGTRVVEKRYFTKSIKRFIIVPLKFGLTKASVNVIRAAAAIAVSIHPVAGPGVALGLTVTEALRSDRLLKLPGVGNVMKAWLIDKVKQQPESIVITTGYNMLGKIQGRAIILIWENGKLISLEAEDGGKLTPKDKKLVSKVSTFADFKFLPNNKKEIGDKWYVSAKDFADFYYPEGIDEASIDGYVLLARAKDKQLKNQVDCYIAGAGLMSYDSDSKNYEADMNINKFDSIMTKINGTGNQYLSDTTMAGTAKLKKVRKRVFSIPLDSINTDIKSDAHYSCTQINK